MERGNFFDYFPPATRARAWGVFATSFGRITVRPGSIYPTGGHPKDHALSWERGRILGAYQLVYISQGQGRFESRSGPSARLAAGTAFLLFPGVWHRYRPDPSSGWTEHWIELQGAHLDRLRREKILDPARAILRGARAPEILAQFDVAFDLARLKPAGFSVRIGLVALQILTLLRWKQKASTPAGGRAIDHLISEAHIRLAQSPGNLSPESLSRSLGIGYSYFRRRFKEQTGFSPKQYQIELRLRRAKEELAGTSLTIKEIAAKLGYHSPYHLTLEFTKRLGVSPSRWRANVSGHPARRGP